MRMSEVWFLYLRIKGVSVFTVRTHFHEGAMKDDITKVTQRRRISQS